VEASDGKRIKEGGERREEAKREGRSDYWGVRV
jgi:hypothetical protein